MVRLVLQFTVVMLGAGDIQIVFFIHVSDGGCLQLSSYRLIALFFTAHTLYICIMHNNVLFSIYLSASIAAGSTCIRDCIVVVTVSI